MAATPITGKSGTLNLAGLGATNIPLIDWEAKFNANIAKVATSQTAGWKAACAGINDWTFSCKLLIDAGNMLAPGTGATAGVAGSVGIGTRVAIDARSTTAGTGTKLTGYVYIKSIGESIPIDGKELQIPIECEGDGPPTLT